MTMFEKKIAVFGCKQATRFIIDFLQETNEVSCIITISPDIAKKNVVAGYEDLSIYLKQKQISFYSAKTYSLTSDEDVSFIKTLDIDIAFVIGWQRLIPESILNSVSIGCFGMHGSSMNLPLGRGRSPMNWSIIEGRKVFYTNLFKYDAGVDSGDILDTFKFSIGDKDNAETMHFKNMLAMKYLIKKNIAAIGEQKFALTKQPDIEPTFYPKRTPADSIIDWNNDVFGIERFIRAVAPPFGGAFTFICDEKITIYDSQVFDIVDFGYDNEPIASIVEILGDGKILVKGYSGLLLITSFSCSVTLKKGDIFHNNGANIKSFPTNKFGKYDQFSTKQ